MSTIGIARRTSVAIAALAVVTPVAACGSEAGPAGSEVDTTAVTSGETLPEVDVPPATNDDPQPDPAGTGTIRVRLEEIDGVFIEGFEVGLRFETPDGRVIGSTLWSEFVASQGDPDLGAFYDSVLEQPVPSGDVVVHASANVGAGPPPEIPDLDGDLRCRLDVEVPDNGEADVVVTFSGDDDCLLLG